MLHVPIAVKKMFHLESRGKQVNEEKPRVRPKQRWHDTLKEYLKKISVPIAGETALNEEKQKSILEAAVLS